MGRSFFATIIFIFAACLPASAVPSEYQSINDSLISELGKVTSAKDSLNLIYDIIDTSQMPGCRKYCETLYQFAMRHGDDDVALDALRMLTNAYNGNDSLQYIQLVRAGKIPVSDLQKETELFIRITYMASNARRMPETKRQEILQQFLSEHKDEHDMDIYRQIEYLFYLSIYLRSDTESLNMDEYLTKLESVIDKLPVRHLAIRSLYYNQASMSYIASGLEAKAIAMTRKLLDIITELEKQYRAKGRMYRNYDRSYYNAYRRILRCYRSLKPDEVDYYYDKILGLAAEAPDIARDLRTRERATIYYLMAKKRYDEVIPIIRAQIGDKLNSREEYEYLIEALLEAATATGDKDSQLMASLEFNNILRSRILLKAAENYKQLQIQYEISELERENLELEREKEEINLSKHRQTAYYAFGVLGLSLIVLIILFVLYRRARHYAKNLAKSNAMLLAERDSLKKTQTELVEARDKAKIADRMKTDFVNNMSHEIRTPLAAIAEYSRLITDCADDSKKPYLNRFAEVITLNTELLTNLVNDVLDVATLENRAMQIRIKPTSLKSACMLSVDNVAKFLKPGVKLVFANAEEPDEVVSTDPIRVEQILMNLLTNAAKFTETGQIELKYVLDRKNKKITFTVTDTGIGIPRGKEEAIFERFEKLDSSTQGFGMGLYICRLLSRLLGGEIHVDPEYRKGARFVFTIPLN